MVLITYEASWLSDLNTFLCEILSLHRFTHDVNFLKTDAFVAY